MRRLGEGAAVSRASGRHPLPSQFIARGTAHLGWGPSDLLLRPLRPTSGWHAAREHHSSGK